MCPLHQGWSGLVLGSNQHIYDFLRIYGFLRAAGERGGARRATPNQVTAGVLVCALPMLGTLGDGAARRPATPATSGFVPPCYVN